MPNPTPTLQEALRLHASGRIADAEAAYRARLDTAPDDAAAHHGLGVLLGEDGRLDAAWRHFEHAAALAPDDPDILTGLGECARRMGRSDTAETVWRTALAVRPSHAGAALNLVDLLVGARRLDEAAAVCREAIASGTEDPRLHNQLGAIALERRDAATARDNLERALQLDPDFATAARNLAVAYIELESFDAALALLHRLFEADKTSPDILHLCGLALYHVERHEEAERLLRRALEIEPGRTDSKVVLAAICLARRGADEAVALCERAIEETPDDPLCRAQLGRTLLRLSRLDEADAVLQRALELAPDNEPALLDTVRLARLRGDHATALERAEKLRARNPAADILAELQYETGQACEALERFGDAFDAYAEANAVRAAGWKARAFDRNGLGARLARLQDWFGAADVAARIATWPTRPPDDGWPTPHFLVGFPRSGTTLVERLLDAHPDVLATDELGMVEEMRRALIERHGGAAFPSVLDALDEEEVGALRATYWSYFEAHAPERLGSRRLVDKNPPNLESLGLIYRVFPDARVLVALRDPRDVCISCFASDFGMNRVTVQFLELASTARAYQSTMSLWQTYERVLPLATHSYRYEDLVAAPPRVLREITDFLGVNWHEDLVEGGRRSVGRLISTPSFWRVTERIDARAVGRWKGYADRLEPVMPLLAPFVAAYGYDTASPGAPP